MRKSIGMELRFAKRTEHSTQSTAHRAQRTRSTFNSVVPAPGTALVNYTPALGSIWNYSR